MPHIAIKYNAPKTVAKFMDSDAFVRIIIGPVGSGKSSGCIVELLRRAREQAPGVDGIRRTRFAVIRNTYRELQDTTRRTFEQWIPEQLGEWSEQDFTFNMKFNDVESEIMFRALDRPGDVKKLLSLELTGAYINEVREIPKAVFDVLQTRIGRFPAKFQGGASWFGIWADTNPWHEGHWGHRLFEQGPEITSVFSDPDGNKLEAKFEKYRQPGGRSPYAENLENLPPGYYERLCLGKDEEYVKVYVDGQDAAAGLGSVYGDLLTRVSERGGIVPFDFPKDGIYTNWDLGVSDSTAIWFWRIGRNGPDIVDYYEAHGQPLSHFFEEIDKRGYTYMKHVLPHDARARTLQTGVSTVELFEQRYPGLTMICPQLRIADGISATRWLFEQPIRFCKNEAVEEGLKCLRAYRYDWDDEKQVFSKTPVHDWSSHGADAARYLACTYKYALNLVPEPTKAAPTAPIQITWDDLFREEARHHSTLSRGRVK